MDVIAIMVKLAPVVIEVADALHMNTVAADLVRKVGAALVAEAKKTATPIDDAFAAMLNAALDHVASIIEAGRPQDAVALLGALGKIAK